MKCHRLSVLRDGAFVTLAFSPKVPRQRPARETFGEITARIFSEGNKTQTLRVLGIGTHLAPW